MKKLFLLLFISGTLSNYAQSNQVLDFKLRFFPETSYNQTTTTSAEFQMTYQGPKDMLEKLKANGVQNPTIIKNSAYIETVLKTGKSNAEENFPVVIEYLKSIDGNGKTILPDGTRIYGKGSMTSLPKLDSIGSTNIDETLKNTVFQLVQNTFAQLNLPEKKVKVGESFVQETPMNFPVGGLNIDMTITTTYKLKSIVDKNGLFDIDQVYTAKVIDTNQNNINVSGTGTGKLIYDTQNYFTTENNLDMKFIFELKKDELTVKLNSANTFKQKAVITKSK